MIRQAHWIQPPRSVRRKDATIRFISLVQSLRNGRCHRASTSGYLDCTSSGLHSYSIVPMVHDHLKGKGETNGNGSSRSRSMMQKHTQIAWMCLGGSSHSSRRTPSPMRLRDLHNPVNPPNPLGRVDPSLKVFGKITHQHKHTQTYVPHVLLSSNKNT